METGFDFLGFLLSLFGFGLDTGGIFQVVTAIFAALVTAFGGGANATP